MFLDDDQLVELTGYRQKVKQVEWLRARAWPFELSASGRPKVLLSYMNKRLGGATESAPAVATPRFDAL